MAEDNISNSSESVISTFGIFGYIIYDYIVLMYIK